MSKYKNRRTVIHGITFDSQKEAMRYLQLYALQKAGAISDLKLQVMYELIPKNGNERAVKYIADFVYTENGKTIVEDVKGYRTKEYVIKRKLLKWRYGDIEFREV